MRKWLSLLLSVTMLFSLAACNGENPSSGESGSSEPSIHASEPVSEPSSERSEGATVSEQPSEAVDITKPESGSTLVAYFSWSGNTEQMARMIQTETGGILFEIAPAVAYTDDYNGLLDIARQEQADNARPELANRVENWDSYDTIFVGYPDWWSDAPMLIYSFLESYDWEGKKLVPFCTSGGSGFGRSLDQLPDSAPGAAILEGLHISGNNVGDAAQEVAAWIEGLDLS